MFKYTDLSYIYLSIPLSIKLKNFNHNFNYADTKFIQNVATRAILDAHVNFSMDNVLFQGNIVTDNQKIGLTGDASMTIRNSDFIGNYANGVNRPGALRTTSNKTVSLIEM